MQIATQTGDVLVTHALGSCLGVTLHAPVARVGGLIHIMLPLSKIDREKSRKNPFMFVDTGIRELFDRAYILGVQKKTSR